MTEAEKHISHKSVLGGDKINPEKLHIYGDESFAAESGNGALLVTDDNYPSGNIMHHDWRLRTENQNPTVATTQDLIPWHLKPSPLNETLNSRTPEDIGIGTEDEIILIRPGEPFFPGDMTELDFSKIESQKVRPTPELLRDTIELTGKRGFYGYPEILAVITDHRKAVTESALQTGQLPIYTAVQPLGFISPINPHPYLQRAGLTVAQRYLNLKPDSSYFQTFVRHLFPQYWTPDNPESLMLGLSQFKTLSFQVNINIPQDSETLAIPMANHLLFSDIAIILSGVLNSSPCNSGILTDLSDARSSVKRVLTTSGYQLLFQSLSKQLEQVNQKLQEGSVPTIARAICNGADGKSKFHGFGRIRGDRGPGNSTIEDNLSPTSDAELEAAYAYLKACQASYIIHCLSRGTPIDQKQFKISHLEKRENLQADISANGPGRYQLRILNHLQFLNDFLEQTEQDLQSLNIASNSILRALLPAPKYGIKHYLNPRSNSYKTGLLTDHIRADVMRIHAEMGIPPTINRYSKGSAIAVHEAMKQQGIAYAQYYEII